MLLKFKGIVPLFCIIKIEKLSNNYINIHPNKFRIIELKFKSSSERNVFYDIMVRTTIDSKRNRTENFNGNFLINDYWKPKNFKL